MMKAMKTKQNHCLSSNVYKESTPHINKKIDKILGTIGLFFKSDTVNQGETARSFCLTA